MRKAPVVAAGALRRILYVVLVAVGATVSFIPASAAANDFTCVGLVIGGTYDNVVVPQGASCTIFSATITGSIKALPDSALDVRTSEIAGNVHGDKAEDFFVVTNTIGGNVEVKEGEASSASLDVLVRGNTFRKGPLVTLNPGPFTWGNIKVEKMRGDIFVDQNMGVQNIQLQENLVVLAANEELRLQGNSVAGNAQVFKNKGTGDKFVTGNTVGGNLQCTENDPPFVGGPNTASQAQGQCF
jgi:hypothetical protein